MSRAHASVLLDMYSRSSNESVRAMCVEMLDKMWPGIRCTYDGAGVRVHYRLDHVSFKNLPRSIVQVAWYIEEVTPQGTARVVKNDRGPVGLLPSPTRALSELQGTLPRQTRSLWEYLWDED